MIEVNTYSKVNTFRRSLGDLQVSRTFCKTVGIDDSFYKIYNINLIRILSVYYTDRILIRFIVDQNRWSSCS